MVDHGVVDPWSIECKDSTYYIKIAKNNDLLIRLYRFNVYEAYEDMCLSLNIPPVNKIEGEEK